DDVDCDVFDDGDEEWDLLRDGLKYGDDGADDEDLDGDDASGPAVSDTSSLEESSSKGSSSGDSFGLEFRMGSSIAVGAMTIVVLVHREISRAMAGLCDAVSPSNLLRVSSLSAIVMPSLIMVTSSLLDFNGVKSFF
nr:hypothetical protein [Tanacetum cinerariifolium]